MARHLSAVTTLSLSGRTRTVDKDAGARHPGLLGRRSGACIVPPPANCTSDLPSSMHPDWGVAGDDSDNPNFDLADMARLRALGGG